MLLSHPSEKNVPEKPLKTHLQNVAEKASRQIRQLRLNLTIISQDELANLIYLIGIFHDFGKATTFFQNYIRRPGKGDPRTQHSFISAAVAYAMIRDCGFEDIWAVIAYLTIKRHHGNLETLADSEDDHRDIAEEQIEDILANQKEAVKLVYYDLYGPEFTDVLEGFDLEDFFEEIESFEDLFDAYGADISMGQRIELFFVVNLLFSTLIENDKKDAARLDTTYFDGNIEETNIDVFSYIEDRRKNDPEKFDPSDPLNAVRDQFLNDIVKNNEIIPDCHFYTLTAPTGIGKTFGCLAFAQKLKNQLPEGEGRIIYCLPYTSIIDQNHEEFRKILLFIIGQDFEKRSHRYLLKHHHLSKTNIKNRKNEEEYSYKDYMDDRLFTEAWDSSFIVTTFVQFFHTLIGHKNRFLKKLHNIANSIVILDEIQNIPPDYHHLLGQTLDIFGRRFNTYFLLITATQPEILKSEKEDIVSIINDEQFMTEPVFNRVGLYIDKCRVTLTDFIDNFCASFTDDNCLIVMNTKKAAISAYNAIAKFFDDKYRVFCLTTYLTPNDRKDKIETIKTALSKKDKIIVVSTQLIEAGVDFSFGLVYRDFGPLDSIIQVAGRCNRNGEYGELGGQMRLVYILNEDHRDKPFHSYVYDPILIQYTETTLENDYYESKDFSSLAQRYFSMFSFTHKATLLLNAICELNYDEDGLDDQIPVKNFKLIEDYDQEEVYILTTEEAQNSMEQMIRLKKDLHGKTLSKDEKDIVFLQIEQLKAFLKGFQISLRMNEIAIYRGSDILCFLDHTSYIGYECQRDYAYDPNIGFLTTPKSTSPSTASF